jgi:DNA invertase Pin-like site-specific DNA recombinase
VYIHTHPISDIFWYLRVPEKKPLMKAKYIRVSSSDQNLERQQVNAKDYSCIYKDTISGAVDFFSRPAGKKAKADIEAGKITELHVASIDRLGRNIIDILTVIEFLHIHSVNLFVENLAMFSLAEGKPSQTFKLIISVLGNVAEMERESLLERQRQGILVAKAKGIYKGRASGTELTPEQVLSKHKVVARELRNGESLRRAAKLGCVSLGTAQKVKRILAGQ